MKVFIDDDDIIVFLNKYVSLLDYNNSKELENELKKIFDKLNKYYNIFITGYYDVTIYVDNNYGYIIKLSLIDECSNFIDMRIIIKNVNLLYKIEDILPFYLKHNIYFYNSDMYLEVVNDIDDIEMSKIIENSNVIYNDVNRIKEDGILYR